MAKVLDKDSSAQEMPSPEDLYQRAQSLKPVLEERADEAAALRRLPDETMKDLKDQGFFKILQPLSWGGYEMDPRVYYKVSGILGEACMTTAWVFSVVGVHNWQLGLLDEKAQKDMKMVDLSVIKKGLNYHGTAQKDLEKEKLERKSYDEHTHMVVHVFYNNQTSGETIARSNEVVISRRGSYFRRGGK